MQIKCVYVHVYTKGCTCRFMRKHACHIRHDIHLFSRTNGVTRGIGSETQRWSRTDEIRLVAMRELKEKQWILEERKRCVHNFILEFILGKTAGLLPDVE